MIFHENLCWQTILMKYHSLFFQTLGKISQNLLSAAVVIGALKVKDKYTLNCYDDDNFIRYMTGENPIS